MPGGKPFPEQGAGQEHRDSGGERGDRGKHAKVAELAGLDQREGAGRSKQASSRTQLRKGSPYGDSAKTGSPPTTRPPETTCRPRW